MNNAAVMRKKDAAIAPLLNPTVTSETLKYGGQQSHSQRFARNLHDKIIDALHPFCSYRGTPYQHVDHVCGDSPLPRIGISGLDRYKHHPPAILSGSSQTAGSMALGTNDWQHGRVRTGPIRVLLSV